MYKYQFIPIDQFDDVLTILVSGLLTSDMLEEIQVVTQSDLYLYLGTISEVVNALKQNLPLDGEEAAAPGVYTAIIPDEQQKVGWESIFDLGEENVQKDLGEKSPNTPEQEENAVPNEAEFEELVGSSQKVMQKYEEMLNESRDFGGMEILSESDTASGSETPPKRPGKMPIEEDTGQKTMDLSDPRRADLAELAEQLTQNPYDYDAINKYVKTAVELGDTKLAVQQLSLFASGLEQVGKIEESIDCYQYILELDPDNREAKKRLKK
jgi:tetratricopeptide (TPR) repeat protein